MKMTSQFRKDLAFRWSSRIGIFHVNSCVADQKRPNPIMTQLTRRFYSTASLRPLLLICNNASSFAPRAKLRSKASLRYQTSLRMALTPVGPFCPFRSSSAVEIEPRMEALHSAGPEFATEFMRIHLDLQMGKTPDPCKLKSVTDGIVSAVEKWENLIARLQLSKDFQTREYAFLTKTHLEQHDSSVESTASMMRWQAACMRAVANDCPPPMPPPNVDLTKMMEQVQDPTRKAPPTMTAMAAAEKITATPFSGDEAAFGSETVKAEYMQLCRDHMSLIEFGGKYDEFDPTGKIYYLDEIEKIEERWDIFFARFSLLGALNQQYVKQCDAFLASMGLTEAEYRQLLQLCHEKMRDDAERERNQLGL